MVHDGSCVLFATAGHLLVGLTNGTKAGSHGVFTELVGRGRPGAESALVDLSDDRKLGFVEHRDHAPAPPAVKRLHCELEVTAFLGLLQAVGVRRPALLAGM